MGGIFIPFPLHSFKNSLYDKLMALIPRYLERARAFNALKVNFSERILINYWLNVGGF